MAIGSAPEIGTRFGLLKHMSMDELTSWWDYMRREWHPDLMKGYATTVTYEEMKERQARRES